MYESYYRPDFKPYYKWRRQYLHLATWYSWLRCDKHRLIKQQKLTGNIKTVQYPVLYPQTRSARDFEV